MDVQAEKIELAKMLLDTEDVDLIHEIKALFESREKDFWMELPEHVKKGAIEAQQQIAAGNYISFDEVKKIIANR